MGKATMTKQRIGQYTILRKEIDMLESKIISADTFITDIVRGSAKQFPYTEQSFIISGHGSRDLPKLQERKTKREAECNVIENFIDSIEDSIVWQIFTRRYIEGKTMRATAKLVGYSEKQTTRIVNNYLKKMSVNVY